MLIASLNLISALPPAIGLASARRMAHFVWSGQRASTLRPAAARQAQCVKIAAGDEFAPPSQRSSGLKFQEFCCAGQYQPVPGDDRGRPAAKARVGLIPVEMLV